MLNTNSQHFGRILMPSTLQMSRSFGHFLSHDHQAVVPSCSHLARRWVTFERRSAWLVVDTEVRACSRETHSPSRASKTYGHNAYQIIHTTVTHHCYQQRSCTHYSTPHTLWALTVATILADAAVTPPSPK